MLKEQEYKIELYINEFIKDRSYFSTELFVPLILTVFAKFQFLCIENSKDLDKIISISKKLLKRHFKKMFKENVFYGQKSKEIWESLNVKSFQLCESGKYDFMNHTLKWVNEGYSSYIIFCDFFESKNRKGGKKNENL